MMDFDVVSPETLEEALDVLAENGDEARVIAGGQSLLNILKQGLMAPEVLVDVRGLSELGTMVAGEKLTMGACVTHRQIELDASLDDGFRMLREMERHLASVQIRNWGTIGGNLCIADPTGDPAPALLALDAEVTLQSKGASRTLALQDFFVDYYETALEESEILTRVDVKRPPARAVTAFEKFRNVEGDAPIVVAAALLALSPDGGRVETARIGLGGVAPVPMRAVKAEAVLAGEAPTAEAIEEAARTAPEETSPIPDLTASEDYKRTLVRVLVLRTLRRALEAARGEAKK